MVEKILLWMLLEASAKAKICGKYSREQRIADIEIYNYYYDKFLIPFNEEFAEYMWHEFGVKLEMLN